MMERSASSIKKQDTQPYSDILMPKITGLMQKYTQPGGIGSGLKPNAVNTSLWDLVPTSGEHRHTILRHARTTICKQAWQITLRSKSPNLMPQSQPLEVLIVEQLIFGPAARNRYAQLCHAASAA